MARCGLVLLPLALAPRVALGQAGVLTVEGASGPDPSVLALAEMEVSIRVDHLHASVDVVQVFENRTGRPLRGRYELALGRGAAVSSFALWEGEHRREAVVVERERGRRIFEAVTQRGIDPGLLETSDEGPRSNVYAVRVDPIPPLSRVRVEVGYSQEVDLAAGEARFVFPLAAREHLAQSAGRLVATVAVDGAWPFEEVELRPAGLRRQVPSAFDAPTGFRARLEGTDLALTDDLVVSFRLSRNPASPLRPALLAYRRASGPAGRVDRTPFGGGQRYLDDRGYFVVRTPFQLGGEAEERRPPQDVVVALDSSLSMGAGKLERAVAAVEGLLGALAPTDRFGLVLFNDEVRAFDGGLEAASPSRVAKARTFFRSGYLTGGTDLGRALPAALGMLQGSKAARRTVVLVTDGQPSLGVVGSTEVAAAAAAANSRLGASRGRLFVLGVGDDANHILLARMADETEGLYAHVGEGADPGPVLRNLVHALSVDALRDVTASFEGAAGIEDLYPGEPGRVFDGSAHLLYGRYASPAKRATVRVAGRRGAATLAGMVTAPLPERDTSRSWIGRGWAQRRIDHLLARIDAEGERPEWVGEIVALAREHLLVTPYTSLIAAARSVLRPREIQPGDPVLRVRVDPSDRAVTALFPFGLVKRLRRLEPGLFETRFLAPTDLADGRHEVELVVTGAGGELRQVRDHFVIDSRAPEPRIDPPSSPVRAGEVVRLRVRSDRDTRRLEAHLGTAPPVELRWSDAELACVGELVVDPSLPTVRYELVVVAEDHAHNVGSTTATVEVLGR